MPPLICRCTRLAATSPPVLLLYRFLYGKCTAIRTACVPQVDTLRRVIHALGAQHALVFMNWQQRLRDVQFKLEARQMEVCLHIHIDNLVK